MTIQKHSLCTKTSSDIIMTLAATCNTYMIWFSNMIRYKTCTYILMFKILDIINEVKTHISKLDICKQYLFFSKQHIWKWVSLFINRCGVSPIHCSCQNYSYRLQVPILWTMCGQLGHPQWSPPTSSHWGRQKSCPVIYQPALLIFQGFCRVNMCESCVLILRYAPISM